MCAGIYTALQFIVATLTYILSLQGSLSYDTGHGPDKTQHGGALFTIMTSQELVGVCVEGVVHINVTPQVAQKISQEEAET